MLEAAARAALDEAQRIDSLLSNYKSESEWSAVNRGAGRAPVQVSGELFQVLSASLAYSRESDGAFDITVGPLMNVWGFFKGEGRLPARTDVIRALVSVGYQHLRLDPVARTVAFDRPGVALDPGGIGKGYAIDRMVDLLKGRGISIALVSSGGSSIYGLGAPPDDSQGWRLTIRSPNDPGRPAAEVFLKNVSLSTSGSYEKFFRADGRRYSHLMDPRTGYPARGTSSASVVAPRTIDSEAWTKAYFVNGREWASRRRPPGTRVFMCDDTEAAECRWIE
jgi:thiamine biosynthesis lipoprotein